MRGTWGTTGSEDWRGKEFDLPHPFALLAKFEAGKPGGESASASLYSGAPSESCAQRRIQGGQSCAHDRIDSKASEL